MQKYGKIANGKLLVSSIQFNDYLPIVYADIPEIFDQTTQYVIQLAPAEEADRIFIGVEVRNLELTDETSEGEMFGEEQLV